jgi:hypothetical protein
MTAMAWRRSGHARLPDCRPSVPPAKPWPATEPLAQFFIPVEITTFPYGAEPDVLARGPERPGDHPVHVHFSCPRTGPSFRRSRSAQALPTSALHMATTLIFPLTSQLISINAGWELPAVGCLKAQDCPPNRTRQTRNIATMTIPTQILEWQATHPIITWFGWGLVWLVVLAILARRRKIG